VAVGLAPVPAPAERCVITDGRLAELSGLAVVGDAVWAMPDGGRRVVLYRLDLADCAVTDVRTAPVDPFDAEDLAAGPGGALWVADTGDNQRQRATVAVIVVPDRAPARLHRLTYPDGPHDAEALLVGTDGVPVVVTKDVGRAGVYVTEVPLDPAAGGPAPLVHAADVVLPSSDTPGGPIGVLGSRVVTGAASGPRVVALRSYTDAWLFAVPGRGSAADVVAALRGRPVRVPLPDEAQGESVAFTADGTLLSGGETRGGVAGEIRAVPGAAALVATAPADPGPAGAPAAPDAPSPARFAGIGAGVAVAALGLLAALLARRAARRR
jgi:hypothetical protein